MTAFERRLLVRRDELEWLYMELYDDREGLEALEEMMAGLYAWVCGGWTTAGSRTPTGSAGGICWG